MDTEFSQNVENQVVNSLHSFWEPVWDNYSENNESVLCFRSPGYPFRSLSSITCIFTNAPMSTVSLSRSSSFIGVLREANIPFKKRNIWRTWKQRCKKCENTLYFPQIMVYTNFERTFKIIILTGIFHSWSALKRIRPIFQIFWRYLNI